MQEISELQSHIKGLEKLEYDILHKVFNMFVEIPENVAVSIPGLRHPSSLAQLKRVRLKIKNNIKVAKTKIKYHQKVSKKVESSSSILNENIDLSDKERKCVNRNPENILTDTAYVQLSDRKTECSYNSDGCSYNQLINTDFVEKTQNENEVCEGSQIRSQSYSGNSTSSKTKSKFQKPSCTITSSNINSNENYNMNCNEKSTVISNLYDQKSTPSTQIRSKS